MSSRCPLPDCGFTAEDGELFNAHMRAHDQAQQDAKDEVSASIVRANLDAEKQIEELKTKEFSALQMTAAFNVVAPLVRALRLLMSDEKMRRFVIETALDFWREINPPAPGTDPVTIPVNTDAKE